VQKYQIGVKVKEVFGLNKRKSELIKKEERAGYLFALPWFIGFSVFIAGPVIASLVLSFTKYEVVTSPRFIGISNYKSLLQDPLCWKSLYNTMYMVIVGVPLQIIVPLSVALLLNKEVKGISWYRTCYYLASIMPMVASSILWLWILDANFGILNTTLSTMGVQGPNWLGDPAWAKLGIILMLVWAATGSNMIIYLAGLKAVPEQLYEAARIDGASWWQLFWNITIPMLTPALFFTLIMGLVFTFQIFTQAYIMTEGGPVNSTLFYVYYLYNNAFAYFKMGYASALAWILFLVIFVITITQLKLSKHWVYYRV